MGQRERIVEIAMSQIGYEEGHNNWTKYGEWFGMQDEWCDMFVCWCANQVGISEDIIPKYACCDDTGEWFDSRGLYKNSIAWGGDYYPQKGDLILFDYDHSTDSDHIGIVGSTDGNKVYTIEGNKNNKVEYCVYDLEDSSIRAFCTPQYLIDPEPIPVDKSIKTRKYVNNEIRHEVTADLWGENVIGSLNPNEECDSFGTFGGKAIVLYEIDGTDHNWKVGFVDYEEGVK